MIENLFKKAFHVSDYSRTLLEHFQVMVLTGCRLADEKDDVPRAW